MKTRVRKTVSAPLLFHNSRLHDLEIEEVYAELLRFIRQAPHHEYRLSIGTDSQVGRATVFVTALHLHRVGRGAIGFITKQVLLRPLFSLREKIYYETSKTLELAAWFTPDRIDGLVSCLLSSREVLGDIRFEFHLDVGTGGATRELIGEMVAMAKGTAFEPKIKPDSYAASSYANRFTKGSISTV